MSTMDEKVLEQALIDEKKARFQDAWNDYIKAVASIAVTYGLMPTPVYRDVFNEATLTKLGEIAMINATDKEIEASRNAIEEIEGREKLDNEKEQE